MFTVCQYTCVKAIRKGEQPNLDQPLGGGPEINLRLPALIPEDYLPDVHARLILYKRIASATETLELYSRWTNKIDSSSVQLIDYASTRCA